MQTEPGNTAEGLTPYQVVAALIYEEHPDRKEQVNNAAKLAIESLTEAMPSNITDQDLEVVLGLISFIAGDLLRCPVNSISERLNIIFDTYSLAAGAVAGEIDLGDTTKADEISAALREAQEAAGVRTDDNTGQYL